MAFDAIEVIANATISDIYYYDWNSTSNLGSYNITVIYVNSTAGGLSQNETSGLNFTVGSGGAGSTCTHSSNDDISDTTLNCGTSYNVTGGATINWNNATINSTKIEVDSTSMLTWGKSGGIRLRGDLRLNRFLLAGEVNSTMPPP